MERCCSISSAIDVDSQRSRRSSLDPFLTVLRKALLVEASLAILALNTVYATITIGPRVLQAQLIYVNGMCDVVAHPSINCDVRIFKICRSSSSKLPTGHIGIKSPRYELQSSGKV